MNKNKIITLTITLISLSLVLLGGTFAWYVWTNNTNDDIQVLAGLDAATVKYDGGRDITGIKLKPTATKEEGIVRTIKINYAEEIYYKLYFNLYLDIIDLPENLQDVSFKYELYKGDNTTPITSGNFSSDYLNNTEDPTNPRLIPCETNSTNHIVLLNNESISSTETTYTLYIWIDGNLPNLDTMQNQTFNFKLHATGKNSLLDELNYHNLILETGSEFNDHIASTTTSVVFTDTEAPSGVTLTDVSAAGNDGVVAWVEDTTMYVSTQLKGVKVIANEDCFDMFYKKSKLASIEAFMLDVSNVTDMSYIFYNCTGLTSLDGISSWDVSGVTDMSNMFYNCTSLTSLAGISGWDVSGVTKMSTMFSGCTGLTTIDLSGWDVSGVTSMSSMFHNCNAVTTAYARTATDADKLNASSNKPTTWSFIVA